MNYWERIYNNVVGIGESFYSNLDRSEFRQSIVFKSIIKNNKNTIFGIKHNFSDIDNIEDFQKKVAVQTYEQFSAEIVRIGNGEPNVLTDEKVEVIEETGGSTKGAKQIPYTKSSLLAFQKALYPWMYDLLTHRPAIKSGTAYWSISPALAEPRQTQAGIPIGLASDADYFGAALSGDILNTLAVPPAVAGIGTYHEWQYWTLRFLLAAEDLTFISVWSPTFLLELVNSFAAQSELMVNDIQNGEFSYQVPEGLTDEQLANLALTEQRQYEITKALQDGEIDTKKLWPKLDTISCWLDAQSAHYRKLLEGLFPGVYIQAKGLLATEGVVSIPSCDTGSGLLALDSAFYEFVDEQGTIYLAHELLIGETYRVLITTYSGLYRYDLGDKIIVKGYKDSTPLINFVGRTGMSSDLCGEKFSEEFISNQLGELTGQVMLVPDVKKKPGYKLIVESDYYSDLEAKQLINLIEDRLSENPQYAYARKIGQLDKLTYLRVSNLWCLYTQYQCQQGRCLGDIKPTVFCNDTGIFNYFIDLSTKSCKEAI